MAVAQILSPHGHHGEEGISAGDKSRERGGVNVTFSQRRKLMYIMMLRHMLLGHPLAAILARIGYREAATWIHWRSLPARGRRKATPEQVHFDMHKSLFWADFFFAPIAHLIACFGYFLLAHRFFMLGPVEAVMRHSAHINFIYWGRLSGRKGDMELARERLMAFYRNRDRWRKTRIEKQKRVEGETGD